VIQLTTRPVTVEGCKFSDEFALRETFTHTRAKDTISCVTDSTPQAQQPARWLTGVWVIPRQSFFNRIPQPLAGPLLCLITIVLYAAVAAAGLRFVLQPEGITSVWPASGLALAIMSLSERHHWPWVIFGIILAHIPGNIGTHRPIGAICLFCAANVTETTVGALILTRLGREKVAFTSVRQLLRLFIVAGPANALIALPLAGLVVHFHFAADFWNFWRLWFVADGLGILLVTPILLSFIGGDCRQLTAAQIIEATWVLAISTILGVLVFQGKTAPIEIAFDLPVVFTIPLIVWSAIRLNVTITSLTALIFAGISVLETVAGHGPFVDHHNTLEGVLVSLQVAIMAWSTCGLVISVAIAQNRETLHLVSDRENRFRLLATSSPAAVFQTDATGQCIYINQRWQTITGQSAQEALGDGWARALHPDDMPKVRDEWRRAVETAGDFVAEYRVRRPSGEIRWITARVTALSFRQGFPQGHIGVAIDVTDRKRIEEELEDRRRFHALIADLSATLVNAYADKVDQAVHDALVRLSESLDFDRVSLSRRSDDGKQMHLIASHFRDGPQFDIGMRVDTLHPWAWKKINAGECIALNNLDELPPEGAIDKASWASRSIKSVMLVPIFIAGTRLFVLSVSNTTRERIWTDDQALRFRVLGELFANAIVRAAADRDLRQSESMLRRLNVELSRTEDRERRRLATVLHDDLAQSIFAATAQLVALRGQPASQTAAQPIDSVISILDQALRQARELTYELCPPVLYELGLVAAITKLGEQITQRHGLICNVKVAETERPLDSELAGLLYQAVRELLMNVVKHAHAHRIDIFLDQRDDHLSITVTDDGIGVVSKNIQSLPSGFGLFNIRERLRALGGQMEMTSTGGAGCSVRLLVPSMPRDSAFKE
jgi:PAS domain S-box-containing protein